jgi:hypothetical protein
MLLNHFPEKTAIAAFDRYHPYTIRQSAVLLHVQNDSQFHTRRIGISQNANYCDPLS